MKGTGSKIYPLEGKNAWNEGIEFCSSDKKYLQNCSNVKKLELMSSYFKYLQVQPQLEWLIISCGVSKGLSNHDRLLKKFEKKRTKLAITE